MKKTLTVALLIPIFLSGCAALGLKPIESTTVTVDTVKVEPVKVKLIQKFKNPNFYSNEKMSQYMTECLINNLTKVGMYSPDSENTLTATMTYVRVYSGQTLGRSESITKPTLSYGYVVKNSGDDTVILQDYDESLLQYEESFVKNAKSLFMMDNENTHKNDENKYLNAMCNRITYKFLVINEIGKRNSQ